MEVGGSLHILERCRVHEIFHDWISELLLLMSAYSWMPLTFEECL